MSKHFHAIGTGRKMFQYARQEGTGLPRRFLPKKKESGHCDQRKSPETAENGGSIENET